MGSEITVECTNCHSAKSFTLGVGFLYSSLRSVMNVIHYKRRPLISEILDNHDVHATDYEHRIYRCPKCNRLYERFYVKILYDQNDVYETIFRCGKCRITLEQVKDEMEASSYPCAFCGQKALLVKEDLLWD
jgi:hypothetical protein